MRAQLIGEASELATVWPRGRSGEAAHIGRLLILACVLLGIAGDALAVYSPRTGRFLQKDPNESGMLHAELWHEGEAPMSELAMGSLQGATTDGSNLFAFVRNSPYNALDPNGLFVSMAAQLVTLGFTSWMNASGTMEEARQGVVLILETDQQLSGYAADQLDMVEWALDWNQSDDFGNLSSRRQAEGGGEGHSMAGRGNPLRRPINYKYRGNFFKNGKVKYNGRKVPFDRRGFPIFDNFAVADVKITQTGKRSVDNALADKAARKQYGSDWTRPPKHTWHHHQDGKRMLLVPTALHDLVRHTGGVAMRRPQ